MLAENAIQLVLSEEGFIEEEVVTTSWHIKSAKSKNFLSRLLGKVESYLYSWRLLNPIDKEWIAE